MKKNILIPTDFSVNATSAMDYALKLYANENCNFYFLHSWSFSESSTRTYITTDYIDQLKEDSITALNALKDRVVNTNSNTEHSFEIIHSAERLTDAIDTAIKSFNIDLIIMGTKGATGAKEIFLGSNTVKVIQKNKQCPVLIVPDDFSYKKPKQIAFPTDYKRFYGEEIIELKRLSELNESTIEILHIIEEEELTELQDYNYTMLKLYLKDLDYSFHSKPNLTNKTLIIQDFIEQQKIDILVMINYKHSFIENIIKEPIIRKIGFQPTIPFLVIPCSTQ